MLPFDRTPFKRISPLDRTYSVTTIQSRDSRDPVPPMKRIILHLLLRISLSLSLSLFTSRSNCRQAIENNNRGCESGVSARGSLPRSRLNKLGSERAKGESIEDLELPLNCGTKGGGGGDDDGSRPIVVNEAQTSRANNSGIEKEATRPWKQWLQAACSFACWLAAYFSANSSAPFPPFVSLPRGLGNFRINEMRIRNTMPREKGWARLFLNKCVLANFFVVGWRETRLRLGRARRNAITCRVINSTGFAPRSRRSRAARIDPVTLLARVCEIWIWNFVGWERAAGNDERRCFDNGAY